MITHPPVVAAASRRRLPGPVAVLLIAWASLAVLGALAGLALAVASLLRGLPGTPPLERSGFGLFSGALTGSLTAFILVALYYTIWAVLWLGRRILQAVVGSKRAPGPAAAAGTNPPASNDVWPGIVGSFVGLLVGAAGGGLIGLVGLALLFGLAPAQSGAGEQGLQPFLAVVSGIVVGLPVGAILGSLVGVVMGCIAGLRLARPKASRLPAI